jgi:hypothetical protein
LNITPAEPEALFDEPLKADGQALPHRDQKPIAIHDPDIDTEH